MIEYYRLGTNKLLFILLFILIGCTSKTLDNDNETINQNSILTLSNNTVEVGTIVSVATLQEQLSVQNAVDDTNVSINTDACRWGLTSDTPVSMGKLGTYEVIVDLEYEGNTVSKPVYFKVVDTQAPVIQGEMEFTHTQEEPLNYKESITVSDNFDQNVSLVFDDGDYDETIPGTYTIGVFAQDSSGNATQQVITVHVLKKQSLIQQQIEKSDNSTLDGILDTVISQIMTESMTDSQKASAVYYWMQQNFAYRGGAANDNSIETNAYYIATNRRGQCQHWAAFAYAILQRMGLNTLYVNGKGRNYNNPKVYHAWVRVTINGQSLHFDPLFGTLFNGVQFNQVTSDFCRSKRSHDWDTSIYGS